MDYILYNFNLLVLVVRKSVTGHNICADFVTFSKPMSDNPTSGWRKFTAFHGYALQYSL